MYVYAHVCLHPHNAIKKTSIANIMFMYPTIIQNVGNLLQCHTFVVKVYMNEHLKIPFVLWPTSDHKTFLQ